LLLLARQTPVSNTTLVEVNGDCLQLNAAAGPIRATMVAVALM